MKIKDYSLSRFSFKYYFLKNKIKSDEVSVLGVSSDHIFKNICSTKIFYEHDLLFHLYKMIKSKNGIAIDVGANIGNHSIYFGKYLSRKVIAIEPSKINSYILNKNLRNNLSSKEYEIHQIAIGNKVGKVNLVFSDKNNLGATKVEDSYNKNGYASEEVEIDKLDNIILEDNISLLKIDVEGLEIDVLKGSENLIKSNFPHIIVEAHNKHRLDEIRQYLQKFNYTILGKFCATPTYHFINEIKYKKNNLSYLEKIKFYIVSLLNKHLNRHL